MNKLVSALFVCFLFLLLFGIRAFATDLFYDPLIAYFKQDYLYSLVPEINAWKLAINMFFRYLLNTFISLGIIWLIFQKKEYVAFSIYFFSIAFIILISVFVFLIKQEFASGYLLLFYIRRFIIHPVFLLILIPAFYYQKTIYRDAKKTKS